MCTKPDFRRRQRGLSLIEMIVFIVIVGVGVAAMARVLGEMTKFSADPMLQKQALAVAQSLLEEIMLQPFTVCDPNDPKNMDPSFVPLNDGSNCTGGDGGANDVGQLPLGSQATAAGKSRYDPDKPFNNVSDYAILAPSSAPMAGIRDLSNTVITDLDAYSAVISITNVTDAATIAALGLADSSEALQIEVTVRTPKYAAGTADSEAVTLTGYRFRYAPRATQ